MEHTDLKDRIIVLLEKIVERNNFLVRNEKISLLEIDIVMEDLKNLYEVYYSLKKQIQNGDSSVLSPKKEVYESFKESAVQMPDNIVQEKMEEVKAEPIKEEKPVMPVVEEPKLEVKQEVAEEVNVKEVVVEKSEEIEIVEEVSIVTEKTEVVVEAKETIKQENIEVEVAKEEYTSENEELLNKTIGEKFVSAESSLHDRIASKKEDLSIAAKLQQTSITSLKDAIGVNEKFLFINELFNGNIQEYNQSVEKLNNFPNMQQAFEFVNELTTKFAWDGNKSASTIEKFAGLIQRRYMNN
ncbi:MAG: hypothetical protein KGZ97_07510 [Bacteroidetes bacterium]|nr:hypothetical protein [Bacteroidota bacterium]